MKRLVMCLTLMLTAPMIISSAVFGGDELVITSGTIGGSYQTTTFRIPSNGHVYFDQNLSIEADFIEIEGKLEGIAWTGPNIDAPSVDIHASTEIRITGSVISADGLPAPESVGMISMAGGTGGKGGSIRLEAIGGYIHIGPLATIKTGDGGHGGNSTVTADEFSPIMLSSNAGSGGNGGDLAINSKLADLHGTLNLGGGGDGGDAGAFHDFGHMTATGGNGGTPGFLALMEPHEPEILAATGVLKGARGGNGGRAETGQVCYPVRCYNPGQGHWNTTNPPGTDGADAIIPGGTGDLGEKGGNAIAIGGDGGPDCILYQPPQPYICLATSGGAGGDAVAISGTGGRGGNGGNGTQESDFGPVLGGTGGQGGPGGDANATAGNGGCATLNSSCGDNGEASARSEGGSGGSGGLGGWVHGEPPIILASCTQSGLCWRPQDGPICGHAGEPGLGGNPGLVETHNGAKSYRWPIHGPTGLSGDYNQLICDHGSEHSHL